MSASDPGALDHTVQFTHEWIEELRDRLHRPSSRDAARLMRAVLPELRDCLPPAEAADLAAQMPLLIRGMYYEGWQPGGIPVRDQSAAAFEAAVAARLGRLEGYRGADGIAAVLATLANRIAGRTPARARLSLPPSVRALWPAETVGEGDADPASR